MVTFSCSQCNKKLKVPDSKVGAKVKCPACATTIVVPADVSGQTEGGGQTAITAKERPTPPGGTKTGAAASASGQKTKPDGRKSDKEDKKSSQTGLWIGLGGGGAALCVAAVVGFFMFRGDKDKPVVATRPAPAEVKPERVEEKPAVIPVAVAPSLPKVDEAKKQADQAKKQADEAMKLLTMTKSKPETSDIIQHVLKSSVLVVAGTVNNPTSWGTGSLVDRKNRLVLTCYHVVANSVKFAAMFPTYKNGNLVASRQEYHEYFMKNNGKDLIYGKLLAYDQRKDLALIQMDRLPAAVQALPISATSAHVGDNVHSIGNPGASGALWIYTPGSVRSVYHNKGITRGVDLQLEVDAEMVETTSATNPGDSGGPLVNDQGELVGVTEGIRPGAQLVSLFVDCTEALKFVEATCKSKGIAWVRDGQPLRATVKVDIPDLVKYLEHTNSRVRSRAVEMLADMGPRAQIAIPAMLKTLNDPDEVIRRQAAKALENLGAPDKADVPLLKKSLEDKNDLVRSYAAGALGKVGPDARVAVPELIKALADPLPVVRQNAAQSLGKVGGQAKDKVIPALQELLKDNEKEVRVASADAVVQVMTPLTAGDLAVVRDVLLKHNDMEVRVSGARALGQLTADANDALPLLVALCKKGNDKVLRLAALNSLAEFGQAAKPAVEALIETVKEKDAELRPAACVALGKIGPEAKHAVPALATALKEDDPVGRNTIIIALGEIGPEARETAGTLGKILAGEKDREVRLRIIATLSRFGTGAKPAAPEMVQAFEDKELDKELDKVTKALNSQMRNPAGQQPPPQQPDPNKKIVVVDAQTAATIILGKVDKGFQEKNAEALSKMGRAAVPALTNGLRSNSILVRWGCIKALGMIGPPAKNDATLTQLAYWARFEPITQIKDDAASAGQKIFAKR